MKETDYIVKPDGHDKYQGELCSVKKRVVRKGDRALMYRGSLADCHAFIILNDKGYFK